MRLLTRNQGCHRADLDTGTKGAAPRPVVGAEQDVESVDPTRRHCKGLDGSRWCRRPAPYSCLDHCRRCIIGGGVNIGGLDARFPVQPLQDSDQLEPVIERERLVAVGEPIASL